MCDQFVGHKFWVRLHVGILDTITCAKLHRNRFGFGFCEGSNFDHSHMNKKQRSACDGQLMTMFTHHTMNLFTAERDNIS